MIRSSVLLLHIAERPVLTWREAVKSQLRQNVEDAPTLGDSAVREAGDGRSATSPCADS